MSSDNRVTHYLDSQHIRYELRSHPHSKSSLGSALSADVPLHDMAKAVMLEDHDGKHMMAILPCDYKVSLRALQDELHRDFKLVKEAKVYQLFTDCDSGAVPPVPQAYHMEAIYDEALEECNTVYLECGDHETLIAMDKEDFVRMLGNAKHGRFSYRTIH
ncbi:YbaK/EbsC family protein [Aestuariibacter halophilus]|uniref:YbaK/EbsC family protein n=1 Tax=Fluctibacter halophilus TaxID=226011 RepID=A0ABS8G7D4_9ALTE|nr:YbaK/EbsC family protein [Aestuariibacter halophilus]MCC2616433.1 YbaK/EbsC family protein [Aestuariibacter halophilus]